MKIFFYDEDNLNLKTIHSASSMMKKRGCKVYVNVSVGNMFDSLKGNDENVVFIDTRLSGGNGSFALAQEIRKHSDRVHIVFMSSHIEDMSFCMKNLMRPSGFLLKPVNKAEIGEIIDEIINHKEKEQYTDDTLFISTHECKMAVNTKQIIYFATLGKKIICKTASGECIEFYSTIKSLENRFSKDFIRCHSGFLANKRMIKGVNRGMIEMKNIGEAIPISKTYKKSVMEFLKSGA